MIFVTGGSGLVGSHLLYKLVSEGEKVRALIRSKESILHIKSIFKYYTPEYEKLAELIDWVEGDILDVTSLNDQMKGALQVYHCAAIVSFDPDETDMMMKINVEGTSNVVNIALEHEVKKLCHVSSVAALGRSGNHSMMDEETEWKESKHNSAYALSKYCAEREVWRGVAEGLPSVIVNPALILGPGDWERSSIRIISSIWDGLKFYSEGINGFVDVRDVVNVMVMLMNSEIAAERFVLVAENLSYRSVFDSIAENLNKPKAQIRITPMLAQFAWRVEKLKCMINGKKPFVTRFSAMSAIQKNRYSNNKIKKELGFEFLSLSETVAHTCKCFLADHNKG